MLLASLRQYGHITIGVASFNIITLLLEGGRASHSVFKIPIAIGRDSMCLILMQSDFVELFREAKLIIWDEAPAQHRHFVEVVD
jgi:ATP-dependent DNA helicase PIF1